MSAPRPGSPGPLPRILYAHHYGRTWRAWPTGPGSGGAWGMALAELDFRSNTVATGIPPVFYIDVTKLATVRLVCDRLGVRVESADCGRAAG